MSGGKSASGESELVSVGSSGCGSRCTEVRDGGPVVLAGKGPRLKEIRLDEGDVCDLDVGVG